MQRYLSKLIADTPKSKITLLSGPRQIGKTTLVRELFDEHVYLNWDNLDHRRTILDRSWSRTSPCVILDEIHKMPRWKSWLKGVYDVDKDKQRFVVTGSARLNTYRKVGDSLAGRFFAYTLLPVDLEEALSWYPGQTATALVERLCMLSGFPEPFIAGDEPFYKKWRKSHLDIVVRQDLIDLKTVHEIVKVELLIEHLRSSVGSPVSFKAISEDLQVSDNTVKSWVQLLEDLYVIFRVVPYGKNIQRAIQKAPKIYFYDLPLVAPAGEGAVFENLVALSLLKAATFWNESGYGEYELRYLRNKDGAEIDFLILKDKRPSLLLEAKSSDAQPSKHFKVFGKYLPGIRALQIVGSLDSDRDYPFGVGVRQATKWLAAAKEEIRS